MQVFALLPDRYLNNAPTPIYDIINHPCQEKLLSKLNKCRDLGPKFPNPTVLLPRYYKAGTRLPIVHAAHGSVTRKILGHRSLVINSIRALVMYSCIRTPDRLLHCTPLCCMSLCYQYLYTMAAVASQSTKSNIHFILLTVLISYQLSRIRYRWANAQFTSHTHARTFTHALLVWFDWFPSSSTRLQSFLVAAH